MRLPTIVEWEIKREVNSGSVLESEENDLVKEPRKGETFKEEWAGGP